MKIHVLKEKVLFKDKVLIFKYKFHVQNPCITEK